jgi:uncharacterized protein DUF6949
MRGSKRRGSPNMLEFTLFLFAITAGYTASAIAANLYRISGATADTDRGHIIRLTVMAIAGPSVFFETAMRGYLAKEWSPITFALVTSGVAYWSLAIGLFVIEVATHI